jgi:hypothetical protein
MVIITRNVSDAKILKEERWEDGLIVRLFPAKAIGRVRIVDSIYGEKQDNITIDLSYSVSNSTYKAGCENLTMHVFIMGLLSDNINDISDELPIIQYDMVYLEMQY